MDFFLFENTLLYLCEIACGMYHAMLVIWLLGLAAIRPPASSYRTVAITGATRCLGEALAYEYAHEKTALVLLSPDDGHLQRVAQHCRELGAPSVKVAIVDICNKTAIGELLEAHAVDWQIDLVVANMYVLGRPSDRLFRDVNSMLRGTGDTHDFVNTNYGPSLGGIYRIFHTMERLQHPCQIGVRLSINAADITNLTETFVVTDIMDMYEAAQTALCENGRRLRALGDGQGIHVNIIMPCDSLSQALLAHAGFTESFGTIEQQVVHQIRVALQCDVPALAPINIRLFLRTLRGLPISLVFKACRLLWKSASNM
ncbi:hypothetical protein BCR43DRAFT_494197 [Syncephalastrum racemosum]|uniref:Uncharacterized protein n=1 Tax=Syncephalastrum racemosum TaxID=13706 RepID=A0A1X2H7P3_SYNRA|nr:hypothetical protein BCR43DRAFT_494197 [Syncephalastrum racemosum]